ncbi:MAG: class I adenylate-forming enzyme family protein [Myxococcota bacterium]
MDVIGEIRRELTGPGGPFELHDELVLGETLPVFKSRPGSVRELLEASAAHGDKEYIVHGDRRIGYDDHLERVASVAQALADRYGIASGDRVAILAANSAEWVMAWWAVASLGGVLSAFNGLWTPDEIRYALADSEPRLLIGDRQRLQRMEDLDLDIPVLEIESEFAKLEQSAPQARLPKTPIEEDDPCLILYTSGTTGRPKGALVSHRALVGFVKIQTYHGIERLVLAQRTGRAPTNPPPPLPLCSLVTVPLFHLSGLYAAVIMMLSQGAKTVYGPSRFDPEAVLRTIEKESVTIWSALGSSGPQVINHPALGDYDLSSLRNIGFGGAPTSPELQRRMKEAFPNARGSVGLGYGLSESGGMATSIGGPELDDRPTSVGRPAIGHEVEIRNPQGERVATGENGEIHIRSAYLMLEYWRNPEATREVLRPARWLATGDIGRLDEEGYLFIDSRARDMILRSGENIYPVEIEHRLDAHPGVRESAVIGVDHPELGQEVGAVVVTEPESHVEPEDLSRWVAETLARYKVPSRWMLRTEPLPRNAAGKVLKNDLLDPALEDREPNPAENRMQGEKS